MDFLSSQQCRALDERAKKLGLDERLLIENASSNLFETIHKLNLGKKVLVVAGKGNNGADVLSCARKMASRGYEVMIALTARQLGKEADFQKDILKKLGIEANPIDAKFGELLSWADFILDGILGVGVKGEVSPDLKKVIIAVNDSKKMVVACDIPSGLCPDSGEVLGAAINAVYTVTFIGPKQGFHIKHGPAHCGSIFVVDIGVSRELLEK